MGINPTKIASLICGVLSVSLLPVVGSAYAETSEQFAPEDRIVVIGRSDAQLLDVAANVQVIDASDIQASGATQITEVLRSQAGIQVSDSNSGAVFSMRGFTAGQAANNTLILIDGRRINNIDIAAPKINALALSQVERIEILSGSAGVLYGDQAVGGVINIITKAPVSNEGGIGVSFGSFDTKEVQADIAGSLNSDWRYYLAASYNKGDHYRDHNGNETGSIIGRIQYQTAKNNFFIETSYFDDDRLLAGALSATQFEENPKQAAQSSIDNNTYSHDITQVVRSAYYTQVAEAVNLGADVSYTDTRVNGYVWGPSKNERSLLVLSPKLTAKIDNADLITGVDYKRGKSDFHNGRSNTQDSYSIYAQFNTPISAQVDLVLGGRYAEVEDDILDKNTFAQGEKLEQDATAFELGVNYRPTSAHRFYTRIDTNFRFAKVDEQAYSYTPGDEKGLKPQTGQSFEAGWDYIKTDTSLRVSLYRLDLEDEIVFDPTAPTPPGGFFAGANVNAAKSRRYGVNLDWDWQLNELVSLGADYNFIDAEFTNGVNQGKSLSWVAEHSGRVYGSLDLSDQWQLFSELNYTGERYHEGDNANLAPELDDYLLANIAINYRLDAWSASLRVDNLFDKEYVSGGYYAGDFSGYYSGTGRDVRLTLNYRF